MRSIISKNICDKLDRQQNVLTVVVVLNAIELAIGVELNAIELAI